MVNLIDQIASLSPQDIVTIIGLITGIIGVIAYLEQRSISKDQKDIHEYVRLNLDYSITQKSLEELVNRHQKTEEDLGKIPVIARISILKEQANILSGLVAKYYSEWKSISDELKALPQKAEIDPFIERTIIDKVVPDYEKRRKRETLKDRITVLSIGLAFSKSVLPSETNLIIGLALAVPLASYAIQFIKVSAEDRELQNILKIIEATIYFGIPSIGLLLIILSIGIITLSDSYDNWPFASFVGLIGFIVIAIWFHFRKRLLIELNK